MAQTSRACKSHAIFLGTFRCAVLAKSFSCLDISPRLIDHMLSQLNRTYDAHMFYFSFESRSLKADDPVVLWMTGIESRCIVSRVLQLMLTLTALFAGGPGCSSELAVFYGMIQLTIDSLASLRDRGLATLTEFVLFLQRMDLIISTRI